MSQFLLGLSKDNSEAVSRVENDSLSQEPLSKVITYFVELILIFHLSTESLIYTMDKYGILNRKNSETR